ncbi:hypothetical protein IAT40_000047 [Kwoniella sp. CBS 6097]
MVSIKNAITYGITRPFPFRKAFHVWSIVFAFALFGIFLVWASATAGYESITVLGESFNTTDNGHWYSPFLKGSGSLCEPAIFSPGSSFYTSNGVFGWKMESDLNIHGSVNGYKGSSLSLCDVNYLYVDIDLYQATVTTQPFLLILSSLTVQVNDTLIDLDIWQTPVFNFLLAYHSAIRYDFGSPMRSNIFSNVTALSDQIKTTSQTGDFPPLIGADKLLSGYKALNSSKAAVIDTHFLCHVKQVKSPASFFVSVAGLSLSLFTSAWAAYISIMSMFINQQKADAQGKQASRDAELGPYQVSIASYEPVQTSDRGRDGYILK